MVKEGKGKREGKRETERQFHVLRQQYLQQQQQLKTILFVSALTLSFSTPSLTFLSLSPFCFVCFVCFILFYFQLLFVLYFFIFNIFIYIYFFFSFSCVYFLLVNFGNKDIAPPPASSNPIFCIANRFREDLHGEHQFSTTEQLIIAFINK